EDDLPDAGDPRRAPLLEALLRVECQLLGRTGEGPTPEEYRRRFPGEEEVVDAVFAARSGGPADDEGTTGDAPAAWPLAEVLGSRIGAYKLLQKLGEGGMGAVYLAEQEHPVRRRVALKVIKPGMDTAQVIARFEAERQALALMDHPHIARVLDAGATDSGR